MKEPLKKGADRRCSPARGSPASQEGDRQQGHPIGTIPNSTNGLLQEPALLLLTSSPAQPVPQLLFGTELKAQEGPFSIQQAQCISPHLPPPFFFPGCCYSYFSVHTHGGCHSRWQEGSAPQGCRRGSSAPWLQPSRPSPQLRQLSCVVDGECTEEKAERHPVKSRRASVQKGGSSHRAAWLPPPSCSL